MASPSLLGTDTNVGVLAQLQSDHERMRSLFHEILTRPDAERCKELFLELQALITTHATLEEKLLYPAFRDAVPTSDQRALYYQAVEEHDGADVTLQKTAASKHGSEAFFGKVLALRDMVEHHAEEEEREFFPMCVTYVGRERLVAMAQEATELRQEIERKGKSRRGRNATRRKTARRARLRRLLTVFKR
jgi:hypothetical protein